MIEIVDFLLVPFLYLMFTHLGHANKQVINLDYYISWYVCCVTLGNRHKSILMTTIESRPRCWYYRKISLINQTLIESLFYAKDLL